MRAFQFVLIIVVFGIPGVLSAECSFKTASKIDELQNPGQIELIEVEIPKARKYVKNAVQILTSPQANIPSDLKRKFSANLSVHYTFGTCKYEAKVRQNGDWKDHIKFVEGGNITRSLDVELKHGNILSAVGFKLLIPATRGAENEVFASLLLKKIGIISPDTFAVNTSVNGYDSVMLFQEKSAKELLEKNLRRESAVFEGDETLIWEGGNFCSSCGRMERFALARLENKSWLLKGNSSQIIATRAYSNLQAAYVDYGRNISDNQEVLIYPNKNLAPGFADYTFALLALNAAHALRPHNRKYYFNSIEQQFEPIYYDGNMALGKLGIHENILDLEKLISKQFSRFDSSSFSAEILKVLDEKDFMSSFLDRTKPFGKDMEKYFFRAVGVVKNNINDLSQLVKDIEKAPLQSKQNFEVDYLSDAASSNLQQAIVRKITSDNGGFKATLNNGSIIELNASQLAQLLSKNQFNGERTVFVGEYENILREIPINRELEAISGKLFASPGIKVSLNADTKTLIFQQTLSSDFILIHGADLSDWSIKFNGVKPLRPTTSEYQQRFNEFGLTGCLTIYQSKLDRTNIFTRDAWCEDSVNIMNSKGNISSISIQDSSSDALDIDFSNVGIESILVINAGNDCVDLSGGVYKIQTAEMKNCGDKGISVGEASKLVLLEGEIVSANIGVASKDSSQVYIKNASTTKVPVCAEVKQKKQEFGGGLLRFEQFKCIGSNNIDRNSIYEEVYQ